jgi:hypothetical protein
MNRTLCEALACACYDGYVQHSYYRQCIDDNECQ